MTEALKHFLEKHADPVKLHHPVQPFLLCVSAMVETLCAETSASSPFVVVVTVL